MLPIPLRIFKMGIQCVILVCWVTVKPLLSCCVSSSWWPVWLLCCVSYFLFPNHLQASVNHIYLMTDMIWNDKEARFSVMCRVPLFLPLFFTYLCRLASPSKVSHLLLFWNPHPGVCQTSDPHSVCQIRALVLVCSCSIFWLLCFQDLRLYSRPWLMLHASRVTNPDTFKHVISIRKIDELNYKWRGKQFPGYRGYLALGNVFLSCVYPKDLYSRSHKVMSISVCVLNLERFLQAVMEERQMDDKNTSGEGCSWSGKAT